MAKDPALLFYIDTWLVATKEMKSDCRGWYLNLILHQYDKKDLPNDIEELANLADVRVSEFERFKQVFEQVLQHKFELKENGRLENAYAKEILKSREVFKVKRESAGKMSYFIRYIRKHLSQDENLLFFIKKHVDLTDVNTKSEQMVEHVFKQMRELYINGNGNEDINKGKEEKKGAGEKEEGENEPGEPAGPKVPIINQGLSVLIVPEMRNVWLKHRPQYQFDMRNDAQPIRLIAEAIAKGENVSAYTNAGIEKIKEVFEALVVWSLTHNLYRNFQLSQFEKYLQTIFENFRNANDGPANSQTEKPRASVVETNIKAAQGAADLIKNKYGQ